MNKTQLKNCLVIGLSIISLTFVVPLAVNAKSERAEEAKTTVEDKKTDINEKLDDTKLKVCLKRENKINSIIGRTSERSTNQLAVFTKIADRTRAFYASSGKVLANYDALTADVDAKKAAAEAAVTATNVTFTCDSAAPKGAIEAFKTARTTQRDALKEYKTAIKNLIVGIKSVQSTTQTTEGGNQ